MFDVGRPGLRDFAQAEPRKHHLDLFTHAHRDMDGDTLPGVEEDLDRRFIGAGSRADGRVFEQERLEISPDLHELALGEGFSG